MAKEKEEKKEKKVRTPEQIEAEKAAKVAKKAEMAAKAKAEVAGGGAPAGGEAAPAEAPKGKGKSKGGGGRKRDEDDGVAIPFPKDYMPRLRKRYNEQIIQQLKADLKIDNVMAVPRVSKIVISMGLGKAIAEKPRLEAAVKELTVIAGQKPVICKAKKSVSNFKLREGMEIGAKVTLRGNRMWDFLDRLINLAIPRVKDFRGLNPKGFDGRGNYNMGLTEQTVFPEVAADMVTFHQGMNITIVTTAGDNGRAQALLKVLGMPFKSEEQMKAK
jgi:large subunit ribosomal protein L5